MVKIELRTNLNFLKDKIEGKGFILNIFSDILSKMPKDIRRGIAETAQTMNSKWKDFKIQNQKRKISATYTTFFFDYFNEFFRAYLTQNFGFHENNLELVLQEKISDSTLIIEYKYYISTEDEEYYLEFFSNIGESRYTSEYYIGYFFGIVRFFGILTRRTIQERINIFLDHAAKKSDEKGNYWHFMIVIKDTKEEWRENYYKMSLIYFLKQFKGIPDEYYEKLLTGREKLYQMALNNYKPEIKEKLIDLLFYFNKKSELIQNLSPLLDILNFVCSRVEDSKFPKLDIIKKNFLVNLKYSDEKKNSLIKLFQFVDSKSSLYTTFGSNNLPSPKAQFDLFSLYMKYYFASGLEALEVGDLLFLPQIFVDTLNKHNKNEENSINANTIRNIGEFMNYFSIVNNVETNYMFFQKIFGKTVSDVNFWFFSSFLTSLNEKFMNLIEEENKKLSENPENTPYSFEIVTDHLCRIIYVLVEKIFFTDSLEEASNNFIDPRGRYIPKNIALRIKELFLFQDMNFSDDVWPTYIISLKKKKLRKELSKYVSIPDRYFYDEDELSKFSIYYNFKSYAEPTFLEEWLVNEIIVRINDFILYIKNAVQDPSNNIEVYEKLSETFLEGIEDDELIKQVKLICQKFAPFWNTLN